ncbi:PPOX class F420-dependent oxidoreductase [Streptomyces hoynatensis]|uniref:PPOX class F420-dependent oxidoreductase n=1 Tax=Streptomyces hoynatensis TaxID=1141874 RepID=A0A3A9YRH7_9ACTN|nr:PPOX class F420-dependent oxidoreductase [Streptomyces hoynatensis]RKN38590.1 PPOX class F420-dependent oxidoreductase [Streptomyces hoynatensis]
MAYSMTKAQWLSFLAEGTRTCKLATVRADGSPHVAPVWFVLDGDELLFTTGGGSVKGRNLRRDPRVQLSVDDERPPYSFVLIRGRAELDEDPGRLLHWATRIAARYMGEDRAEEYGRRNGVPGELLVRVRPEQVVAEGDLAS